MRNKFEKYKQTILNTLYDLLLSPDISPKECYIMTLAKNDLENRQPFLTVLKR